MSTLVWIVQCSNPLVSAATARRARCQRMPVPTRRDGLERRRSKHDTGRRPKLPVAMTQDEERELREQLARLLQEHRDLDAAIVALQSTAGADVLQVQRLKKRKLMLRDRIRLIEDQLTPDIIA